MGRSHRRRRQERPHDDSLDRLIAGWKRSEYRDGAEWWVQPISSSRAQKQYVCPRCGRSIAAGVAHVVVWRADGVMGDSADLAARRHWHLACWG